MHRYIIYIQYVWLLSSYTVSGPRNQTYTVASATTATGTVLCGESDYLLGQCSLSLDVLSVRIDAPAVHPRIQAVAEYYTKITLLYTVRTFH